MGDYPLSSSKRPKIHLHSFLDVADEDVSFLPALGGAPFAPGFGLFAVIVRSSALSKPSGQKMPNMSTVAIVMPYYFRKIMDITANMFINIDGY